MNIEQYPRVNFGKRDKYNRGEMSSMIRNAGAQCLSMGDHLVTRLDGLQHDPETQALVQRAIRLLNEAHNKLVRIANGEPPSSPTSPAP